MKKLNLLILLTLTLSSTANSAEYEYYHCEKGIDSYWRFDVSVIDDISPDAGPAVRVRQMSEVSELSNVRMSKDWFRIIRPIQLTEILTFISRTGKKSMNRHDNPILGIVENDFGVCGPIVGEDLDTLFMMQSELRDKREEDEAKKLANQPAPQNWN